MTLQRSRQNFCSLDAKANAIVLDRRECGLRNTSTLRQVVLVEALKFSDDAHESPTDTATRRLARRYPFIHRLR